MKKLLLLLPLLASCTQGLTPKQQHALDVFDCRVAALEPVVGTVFDTADLVKEVIQGKVDPVAIMITLGAAKADITAAAEAWNACAPQPVVAPPPAPGDKIVFNIPLNPRSDG